MANPQLGDLINTAQRRLTPGVIEPRNQLAQPYTAGAGQLQLAFAPSNIRGGIKVSVDLEIFYVTADPAGTTVTVLGGQDGSSPANHAANAIVKVNPRFSDFDIAGAINDDLDDLSSPENGLFQMKSVDLTYNPVLSGYDLTGLSSSQVLEVYSVRYKQATPSQYWPKIKSFKLVRAQTDAAFPSGMALFVYDAGFPGLPMHVEYKAPFAHLTNLTDDVVAVAGLTVGQARIPPLGAVVALSVGREIKRNFLESQGDPARRIEVPPGATSAAPAGIAKLRQSYIDHEAAALSRQYPIELMV